MSNMPWKDSVDAIREFNRFYTARIGVLGEGLWDSRFSLAEARVLYELANGESPSAAEICASLALDAGYVSRILKSFSKAGLVGGRAATSDGRRRILTLTAAGRKAFASISARSREDVRTLISGLSDEEQTRLLRAMRTIEDLLGGGRPGAVLIRNHRPGDIGWVVERHGSLYAREYGYNEEFEALVADITAQFLKRFDAKCERCWIAELDGEPMGSVFLVRQSKTVAKLRLLLVDPAARGHGIGSRLVSECIRFGQEAGYRKMVLWTQSELTGARRIYQAQGFKLVKSDLHHSFGHDLVGEYWSRPL